MGLSRWGVSCGCGKPVHATGLCRACYQRRYDQSPKGQALKKKYSASWRARFGAETKAIDPLEVLVILTEAFNVEPKELAAYLLSLPGGGQPYAEQGRTRIEADGSLDGFAGSEDLAAGEVPVGLGSDRSGGESRSEAARSGEETESGEGQRLTAGAGGLRGRGDFGRRARGRRVCDPASVRVASGAGPDAGVPLGTPSGNADRDVEVEETRNELSGDIQGAA